MPGANLQKPCLIETRQGFSVLYNNRLLYSKYSPTASIEKLIDKLTIQENTLVLCYAPVLFYGFEKLLEKLPENSFALAIETDEILFDFSLTYESNISKKYKNKYAYCFSNDVNTFCKIFDDEIYFKLGNFRRTITIDFSGATQIKPIQYQTFTKLADDFINTFWKNRITLVKMGRLYAKNIFKNLVKNAFSKPLSEKSINQPVLVLGAGTSIDKVVPFIQQESDRLYILAVDAVVISLLKHGIIPDKIIAVESQLANEKAFIGLANSKLPVIADLTSRRNILNITKGEINFFLSEYAKTNFLNNLKSKKIISKIIPPLGSVGLAAVEIALHLRASENIPIFFAGLDFCYDVCKTHCNDAPHIRNIFDNHNRLKTMENPASSFKNGAFSCIGKDGIQRITDNALFGYAKLFSARYSMKKNLYDIGDVGMDIGSRYATPEEMINFVRNFHSTDATNESINELNDTNPSKIENSSLINKTKNYYNDELNSLYEIRNILSGKIKSDDKHLENLLINREYLFLHFPDAHLGLRLESSFLKRIRAEIDFFIKDIETGLLQLNNQSNN